MLVGLSYGAYAPSIEMQRLRGRRKEVWDSEALAVVLEYVHPGNLGYLPPAPEFIAMKARQIGLIKRDEDLKKSWY